MSIDKPSFVLETDFRRHQARRDRQTVYELMCIEAGLGMPGLDFDVNGVAGWAEWSAQEFANDNDA